MAKKIKNDRTGAFVMPTNHFFATRLRLDDMLPIAHELDDIGYWSLEAWGGATFDSCIRFFR